MKTIPFYIYKNKKQYEKIYNTNISYLIGEN